MKNITKIGLTIAIMTALLITPVLAKGFIRGIVINVDGTDYFLAGAPDAPGGAIDIPGHSWVMAGPNQLVGKHYNTGPFGAPQWWSSDAPDGEYLYKVHGIIDTWTSAKAARYASRGYVHYHELVETSDGTTMHPTKVVWLRHTARTSFTLDGGPHPPDTGIEVTPGVHYEFLPNWMNPYPPP
jgi:selenium-binding protein 1